MRLSIENLNEFSGLPSMAGHIVVASPENSDAILSGTVCLVTQDDLEKGSIGLVLNRPILQRTGELWSAISGDRVPRSGKGQLRFGGPYSGPIVAIHRQPDLAEAEMGDGLFFAAKVDHLQRLIKNASQDYRIFLGHVGWEPGQLLGELVSGKWHLLPADQRIVFPSDDAIWDHLLHQAAGRSIAHWVGARHIPESPLQN